MDKYPSKEYLEEEYLVKKKSVNQIAEENGVKPSTVRTHLYEKRVLINGNKISKEDLIELYVNQKKSMMDVARELGTNDRLVSKYLDKYGIEKCPPRHDNCYNPKFDQEWIKLYTEDNMSANQIAKIYNTTHSSVISHLKRCGIETRDLQMAQLNYQGNYNINPDLFNYEKMYDLHINQRLSIGIISDIYDLDLGCIETCLKKLNIPIYNSSNAHLLPITTNTKHNFEPSLSQRIRSHCVRVLNPLVLERDNYVCRICGKSYEKLEVHHHRYKLNKIIKYIIEVYYPIYGYNIVDNIDELYNIIINEPFYQDLNNMITVCISCHHNIHNNEEHPTRNEAKIII